MLVFILCESTVGTERRVDVVEDADERQTRDAGCVRVQHVSDTGSVAVASVEVERVDLRVGAVCRCTHSTANRFDDEASPFTGKSEMERIPLVQVRVTRPLQRNNKVYNYVERPVFLNSLSRTPAKRSKLSSNTLKLPESKPKMLKANERHLAVLNSVRKGDRS